MGAKNPSRLPKVIFALFIALTIFAWGRECWKDFWLYLDGRQIPAILIVQGNGMKPGTFVYEYTVKGVQYNGDCRPGGNAQLGQQTLVFVSRSHPWLSSAQLPSYSPRYAMVVMALLLWLEFYIIKTMIKPSSSSNKPAAI
jgi:hypothetical protein